MAAETFSVGNWASKGNPPEARYVGESEGEHEGRESERETGLCLCVNEVHGDKNLYSKEQIQFVKPRTLRSHTPKPQS